MISSTGLFRLSLLAIPMLQLVGGLLQGAHGESSYFEKWPAIWLYLAVFGMAIYAKTRERDSANQKAIGLVLALLALALVMLCSVAVRVLIFGSGIT